MEIILTNVNVTKKVFPLPIKYAQNGIYFKNTTSGVAQIYYLGDDNPYYNSFVLVAVDLTNIGDKKIKVKTCDNYDSSQTRAAFVSQLDNVTFDTLDQYGTGTASSKEQEHIVSAFNITDEPGMAIIREATLTVPSGSKYLLFNFIKGVLPMPELSLVD